MPIHAGVPLFVMISGYFCIRFSFKSLSTLLSRTYFYVIAMLLIGIALGQNTLKGISDFQIIGLNKLWFINTYLCLYLVAPAITSYFLTLTSRQRWVLMCGLAFFTFYVGDIKMSDPALVDGKNLLNFIFLYLIGSMLHLYEEQLKRFPTWMFLVAWIALAVVLVSGWLSTGTFLQHRIWALAFPYNSPLLLLGCILLFVPFGRIRLQSPRINWLAASVFAIYLLHCAGWNYVTVVIRYFESLLPIPALVVFTFFFSFVVMAICILIDKLLSPLWDFIGTKARRLDDWYNATATK